MTLFLAVLHFDVLFSYVYGLIFLRVVRDGYQDANRDLAE